MSWTNLTTEILKTECIGSSLSTINENFGDIDTYLRDLSAEYMPIDSVLQEIEDQGALAQAAARENLGIGAVATLPASVAAKAWVNFNGASSVMVTNSGTYSKVSSTTINVSITGHGLRTGDYVYLNFTSGTASDKTVVVTSYTPNTFTAIDQNAWTLPAATSSTTSGNVSFYTFPIRDSYNVRKIIRLNDYNARVNYGVYFDSNLAHGNYAAIATASIGGSGSEEDNQAAGISRQYTNFFLVGIWSGSTTEFSSFVNCVVFG